MFEMKWPPLETASGFTGTGWLVFLFIVVFYTLWVLDFILDVGPLRWLSSMGKIIAYTTAWMFFVMALFWSSLL